MLEQSPLAVAGHQIGALGRRQIFLQDQLELRVLYLAQLHRYDLTS